MNHRYIYILMFAFFSVILFSCGESNNLKANVITDSLIRATEDIAIGEARFGISESDFNRLFPDSMIELSGHKYIVSSEFDNSNKLNSVYLIDHSTFQNTEFDQSLFNRMDSVKRYFMKTYGRPQVHRGYPKKEKMIDGKVFNAYIWHVGKKEIFVGIALEVTKRGNIYYVLSHVDRKE